MGTPSGRRQSSTQAVQQEQPSGNGQQQHCRCGCAIAVTARSGLRKPRCSACGSRHGGAAAGVPGIRDWHRRTASRRPSPPAASTPGGTPARCTALPVQQHAEVVNRRPAAAPVRSGRPPIIPAAQVACSSAAAGLGVRFAVEEKQQQRAVHRAGRGDICVRVRLGCAL